jgi:hypothetical protein
MRGEIMIEVETPPCLGCGQTTWFTMTEEQHRFWKQGVHIQNIFPDWSAEDREMLISGTCPSCWEEMWAEEEEEDYDDWDEFDDVLMPESDFFEYEPDWYVD